MNPYLKISNYKPTNIKHYLQGKYRAFIIRQYRKLNLPTDLPQKIMQYQHLLGNCPSCGCPMAEILLTDKECEATNYVMGIDPHTDKIEPGKGIFWQIKNGYGTTEVDSPLTEDRLKEFLKNVQENLKYYR